MIEPGCLVAVATALAVSAIILTLQGPKPEPRVCPWKPSPLARMGGLTISTLEQALTMRGIMARVWLYNTRGLISIRCHPETEDVLAEMLNISKAWGIELEARPLRMRDYWRLRKRLVEVIEV